jgi:hypothetical protein
MKPLLSGAFSYINLGYAVLPCKPKSKIPATKHGLKNATLSFATITQWWQANPNFNVGLLPPTMSWFLILTKTRLTSNGGENFLSWNMHRVLGLLKAAFTSTCNYY